MGGKNIRFGLFKESIQLGMLTTSKKSEAVAGIIKMGGKVGGRKGSPAGKDLGLI